MNLTTATHKTKSNPEFNSPFNQQFYFGIVEDNADPEALGRVRVRVFGIHEESKIEDDWKGVKTEDLPWATVLMPSTNGASGIGRSATGCTPGTQVMLIFRDKYFQAPLVLGTIPCKQTDRPIGGIIRGFIDPSEDFPLRHFLGLSSLGALASAIDVHKSGLTAIAFNCIKDIPIAGKAIEATLARFKTLIP